MLQLSVSGRAVLGRVCCLSCPMDAHAHPLTQTHTRMHTHMHTRACTHTCMRRASPCLLLQVLQGKHREPAVRVTTSPVTRTHIVMPPQPSPAPLFKRSHALFPPALRSCNAHDDHAFAVSRTALVRSAQCVSLRRASWAHVPYETKSKEQHQDHHTPS